MNDLREKIKQTIRSAVRRGKNVGAYIESYTDEIMSLISQHKGEQSEFGPVDLTNVEPDKFNLKIKEGK